MGASCLTVRDVFVMSDGLEVNVYDTTCRSQVYIRVLIDQTDR